MLSRNAVFRISKDWIGRPFQGLCRFLATDGRAAAIIAIPEKETSAAIQGPVTVSLNELLLQMEKGHVTPVQHSLGHQTEDELSAAAREAFEKRKTIFNCLELDDNILFDAASMAKLLRTASATHNVPERTIRRMLYAYYVGGQTEQALIPHYNRRGAPGKPQKLGTRKRGRRAVKDVYKGNEVPLPEVLEKLKEGAEKHYRSGAKKFISAYVATLHEHFRREGADPDGKNLNGILLPKKLLPTEWQFKGVIRALEKEKGKRRIIPGRRRQQQEPEERRGRATDGVRGPGHRFEIDATKMQVQLVSRWSRTDLVGTATLYIVVDVWSSAIVGYYITHENASWRIAASALANTFAPKGEVFKRLGLAYEVADWPSQELCSMLTGDRAELLADNSIGVSRIGIKIEIAAPMCPEMKGTVESKFNEIKSAQHTLPGAYAKDRKRREKDGKDDAVLNIDEAEMILVKAIMAINKQPVSPDRIPPEVLEMGWEDISRMGLYKWGIKNKPGLTRTLSEEEYKYYLLSPGMASVDMCGINFRTHVFRPPFSMLEILSTGTKKVEVRYNEHNAQMVYFRNPCTGMWEEAFNTNENIMRRPVAFYEWDLFRKTCESLEHARKLQNAYEGLKDSRHTKAIVRQAKAEKKEEAGGKKPRKSRRAIRDNKAEEKRALRSDATHQLLPETSHAPLSEVEPAPIVVELVPTGAPKSTVAVIAELWEDD
ncbi:transposase family protein [Geomonas nitrogeniifigens]|uniref:Transposase family protein n=1 Tax=Geomonas diazotrophica TaxID=2843197 RepID=A0ABX8JKX7_9BACT|nr:transposase family protein [Geomonas nitrogeniifigens]QWV97284.1 transposase family protein [Geomonas nitrogeniifigens]